jgi:hypothetical protein
MISRMSGPANFVVRTVDAGGTRAALAELVQAWARDVGTGAPIHILELGRERRGAGSRCECPSCGLPLTAVNAAKTEFVKRPHFRHPEGAQRDECLVLAGRAAAMRQLIEDGWLELPRRQMSARATGLSGQIHEAWVELPTERVRIADIDFRDRAVAMLTLDDGRQLRVDLIGTLDGELVLDGTGHPVPTIFLDIDDPSLVGMAPDALRARLKLLPNGVCWRAHWDDVELARQAAESALGRALFYFDEVPAALDMLADLDPALKRQTVLHYEVMNLLAESQHLHVPGWVAEAEVTWPNGRVEHRREGSEPERLSIDLVGLEKRFGGIIPDVTCKAWPDEGGEVLWPLFIEVTVTNAMTAERLERIRDAGQPTLEVDLSLTGGRVDREGLQRLVVDELGTKRWLFHPAQAGRAAALAVGLAEEMGAAEAAAERRTTLRQLPLGDLAYRYVDAALQLADAEAAEDGDGRQVSQHASEVRNARAALTEVIEGLEAHGYPEAGDSNLIGMRGMVARILSIQLARPVGYRVENVAGVLNAIEQSKGVRLADTSIYLIAVRTYRPPLSDRQQVRFEEWADRVRGSLKRGETTYLRDPSYDRLLSIIFPEMAAALAKPGGKRPLQNVPASGDWESAKRMGLPTRQRATFLSQSPRSAQGQQRYLDTLPADDWLKGRDLEAWKKANPESAKIWFGPDGGEDGR